MSDYKGKSVIVTGGAGHIGRAISEAYLRAGANVIICGRRQPSQPVAIDGQSAIFVQADIRDPGQAQQVIDQCMAETQRLDILVNNAGGSPPIESATASPSITDKIIQLNLVAPLILSQMAYQVMSIDNSCANIINIASVSGARPSPGTVAYGAAKAGLLSATKSLAQEWGPTVRVNAIIVGLVHHDAGVAHYGGPEGFAKVANMLPLKRMAEPSDIADACLYLSSQQAAYVSGATLEVDGGGEVPVFLHLADTLV
ncbi:MAG: SDR family oxidoreductase [Porticoccaceae bacterium]|nr:SDR family oxidoreductase [Porticoccaceae bacterium]MBT6027854.1 SDR family oxidoreductase [Porticoccaceae bacterium]MBT6693910.1 SDR family oxidoreductase [Porticoccaceae bacterium]MBT7565793.1 SDR family oxidoreductase [Porticoccaceae bacterium]